MKYKENLTWEIIILNTIVPILSILVGIILYYAGIPIFPVLIVTITGITGLIFVIKEVFIEEDK